MANDSIKKTLTVAFLLCIVCSVLVSVAAVSLKPIQERNKALALKENILAAAGLMEEGKSIDELFQNITPKVIDLSTGAYTDIDPAKYDQKKYSKDPATSIEIAQDIAKIRRRSKFAAIYLVEKNGKTETIILPIYGKGLWGTMYAFIAFEGDGNTVKGLTFYDHKETPGLGGEVDNPRWKQQWVGKKAFNEQWKPVVELVKGGVNPNKAGAIHQVDGLSGATLTNRGVRNLIHYWLGSDGYGVFLAKLRSQGGV
ncbi:MAG: Na(+)-translocating NADH-quinone reductase subunit C [SAR324 cluster bacterium]|uniref:Na(+)-translocating NADH-quinone reductase subunit C n=1 Tax=SAR324 cluster bacterium TaxID=2024889 RepID=A0A2A4T550_9DELT|nr:MAG: Na(+)-translocating NADH-quinone reductase subunit C [SAR324 cluster bacterium]